MGVNCTGSTLIDELDREDFYIEELLYMPEIVLMSLGDEDLGIVGVFGFTGVVTLGVPRKVVLGVTGKVAIWVTVVVVLGFPGVVAFDFPSIVVLGVPGTVTTWVSGKGFFWVSCGSMLTIIIYNQTLDLTRTPQSP